MEFLAKRLRKYCRNVSRHHDLFILFYNWKFVAVHLFQLFCLPAPALLLSGNHQFVLCIYESVSILFCLSFCFVFWIPHRREIIQSFPVHPCYHKWQNFFYNWRLFLDGGGLGKPGGQAGAVGTGGLQQGKEQVRSNWTRASGLIWRFGPFSRRGCGAVGGFRPI